jgi:hypothetical protein
MNLGKFLAMVMGVVALMIGSRAQEHEPEVNNRFYIGPRLHFNIHGSIRNIAVPASTGPQYDDGYVDIDISTNYGGRTWNWGYSTTNNQIFVNGPGNRELELHGVESPRDNTTDKLNSDVEYGFEVGYGRDFWKFGKEEYPIRVGVQGSFTASSLALGSANTVTGQRPRISDRYAFPAGVIPPNGPYNGPFAGPVPPNGPAPLILTNIISRTTSTETVTAAQHVDLDGTFWGFRLGPYIELPWPGYRHSFELGLGLTMVNVDAKLSYEERFTTTGLGGPPQARIDDHPHHDFLFGFYLNAKAYYWVNDVTALYIGGEYQYLDTFVIEAENKRATVDFGSTLGVTLGVMYVF